MNINNFTQFGDWIHVRNVARVTKNKQPIFSEVSDLFKRKMIISRHEPLKTINYLFNIECPQWVAMHFVRHKHALHFVGTSRDDIMGVPRDPNRIVSYALMANPIALMDMAEKRLCRKASKDTQAVMQLIVDQIETVEPFLAKRLRPACVVLGYCPEQFDPCGYDYSSIYKKQRDEYLQDSDISQFKHTL